MWSNSEWNKLWSTTRYKLHSLEQVEFESKKLCTSVKFECKELLGLGAKSRQSVRISIVWCRHHSRRVYKSRINVSANWERKRWTHKQTDKQTVHKQPYLAADESLTIDVIFAFLKTNPTWFRPSFCIVIVRSNGLRILSRHTKKLVKLFAPYLKYMYSMRLDQDKAKN